MSKVYLIGSLRNPDIPAVANAIRQLGFDVFDDWYAAGNEADDKWKEYEQGRGRTFEEALDGYAANHVFEFDKAHLMGAGIVVLLMPAGKSGHMEFGWAVGRGAHGVICIEDDSDRWDVMYRFADKVVRGPGKLLQYLKGKL